MRLAWLAAAAAATCCLLEGSLRAIVYSDVDWGKRWRIPWLYADRWSDSHYFQLAQRWTDMPGPLAEQYADPRLGWVDESTDRERFSDPRESAIGDRRPVLCFGDSYVRCMTDADDCFEGLLERSPLGATHILFNYGVRAYGIDQIAIMARLALPRWKGRNAIVAIGIFIEDDLDRAWLDHRGWPKPRFTLGADGALVEPAPVPTPEEYDRRNPLWKHSLAWGWLLNSSGWLPAGLQARLAGTARRTADKQRLCTAILERLEHDLQEAGVEHFYVLFPSVRLCKELEPSTWQEIFLLDFLESHRLPYVDVKRELLAASLAERRHPSEYFGLKGPLTEHLTPDGNQVAFRALLRGIRGDFESTSGRPPPHPGELHKLEAPDETRFRFERGWSQEFPDADDGERIVMTPSGALPVRAGLVFSRRALAFLATARLWAPAGADATAAPIRVVINVDRAPVLDVVLDASRPSVPIALDLLGKVNLELVVSRPDSAGEAVNSVVFARPRFQ